MKLHLPKHLFTALLAACMLMQAAAENYTYGTSDNNSASKLTAPTANDTITFNKESGYLTQNGGTINAAVIIEKLNLSDGYSNATYTFKNTVTGTGDFSFKPTTTATNQNYVFEGDMSGYSGNMSIMDGKGGSFTFNNNQSGTSTISGNATTVNVNGATMNNSAISVSKVNVSGNSTFTGTVSTNTLTIASGSEVSFAKNLTISGSIENNGTMTMGEGAGIFVSSLGEFERTLISDSFTTSGSQEVTMLYSLYKGNAISGVSSITYGNETKELNDKGQFAASQTAFVVADNDTVTVGGNNATAGTNTATVFALANTGTLVFADTQTGNLVKEVVGNGRVEVTLQASVNHSRGVKLSKGFYGTLAVNNGWMDLTTFTTAADATLELHAGQHWSNGGTVTQAIKLLAENADDYVFRNSGSLTLAGKVTGKYLDLGTTDSNGGTLILSGQGNEIEYVTIGTMNLTIAEDMAFTRITANNSAYTVSLNAGKTMTLNGGTEASPVSHKIGTLSAASAGVTLGNYATLTLSGGTEASPVRHSVGTLTGGTGSKLELAANSVLNKVDTINTTNGTVTLTGSGTYNYGSYETKKSSLSLGLTLDENAWTGTVNVSGGASDGMTNWDNFSNVGTANSWVSLSDVQGHLSADSNIETNLILESGTALNIKQGSSSGTAERYNKFKRCIKGDGEFKFSGWDNRGGKYGYYFLGDTSEWSGQFNNASRTAYDVNVYFEQEGTEETPAQIFKADETDETIGVVNTSTTNKLNVHIGKAGAHDKVVQFNGVISEVNELNVNNQATFGRNVDVATVKVAHNATARFDSTLTAKSAQLYENVTVGESTETRLVASITGKENSDATMSKVQMSSTGISGTADGASVSNADIAIAQLAQDASFTIADMTLTNTTITAATAETRVNLSNVSASNLALATGKFTMNAAPVVGLGGTEATFNTGVSSLTAGAATLTLDLDMIGAYESTGAVSGATLTITLGVSGADFSSYTVENWQALVGFDQESWLGQALVDATFTTEAVAAPAEAGSAAPTVSYGYAAGDGGSNVGMLTITITGLNVPEPATATLSLLALAALAARRRRKA